jgi:hypothetical protein
MTNHSEDNPPKLKDVTIYWPTRSRHLLPATAVTCLGLVLLANVVSLLSAGDWSVVSLKLHLLTTFIILSLLGLLLMIAYYLLRIISPFCMIDSDSFIVCHMGMAREYGWDEIDYFLLSSTASLTQAVPTLKIRLFIVTPKHSKEEIFTSDMANRLQRSWNKTAKELQDATEKAVSIELLVEDPDGRIYDLKDYKDTGLPEDKVIALFKDLCATEATVVETKVPPKGCRPFL